MMCGFALMSFTKASLAAESSDPIKFAMNDWSSQLINSRIIGSVLEQAGYNVEYVQADAAAQFAGLKRGDLHVQMEVWSTAQSHLFKEGVGSGKIDDLGETGMAAIAIVADRLLTAKARQKKDRLALV